MLLASIQLVATKETLFDVRNSLHTGTQLGVFEGRVPVHKNWHTKNYFESTAWNNISRL